MKRALFCITIGLFWLGSVSVPVPAAAHDDKPGRWVDAGPWNGLLDCESSPTPARGPLTARHHPARRAAEVRVDQVGPTGDYGAFQFIRPTWNSVSRLRNRDHLIGVDPRTRTLATQLRQAEWLRRNEGISQWSCGYRYNDGSGPVYVTGEWNLPNNPERCAKNLRNHWGFKKKIARSVCNV